MHCILPITLADLSKKASYKKKRWPQSAAGDIVDHPFNRSSLLRITEGKASFLMFPACFFLFVANMLCAPGRFLCLTNCDLVCTQSRYRPL